MGQASRTRHPPQAALLASQQQEDGLLPTLRSPHTNTRPELRPELRPPVTHGHRSPCERQQREGQSREGAGPCQAHSRVLDAAFGLQQPALHL